MYSLCTVYSFFSARYLANLKENRVEESKYYLHNNYEFWLSDNGDVLVTFAFVPNMEEFFNIENFKRNRFGRTYSVEPRIERCEGFDSKKNSPREGYCNYLIIRHDGTIKYGPKSGNM